MKFKKMELYGFKSFADKLEVSFDSGVTAIVGPNGCGKSNVADGIRFVMGETSAKSMRGSTMQDVIFNGTETRKPLSFCEVALHFDNSERIFPLDYNDVVISRKLYKNGESEYAINKNPVRRKDVVDALRDSGLGRDSYCVIGQGKIDSLLSVKPEDRRSIFEEAAGISRFKSRRQEAENKLERTRDNLTRLNDIIYELENQLGPLTKQSENAKKFLEYKERLKNLELNIYIYQYDHASESKAAIREKLNGIDEELELNQSALNRAVNTFNQSIENISKLDENIEGLREELLKYTVELEKQNGEAKLIQEKINSMSEQNNRLDSLIKQDQALHSGLEDNLKEKNNQLENAKHELGILAKQIEKVNADYLQIVDKLNAGELSTKQSGEEIYNALESLGDAKSALSSLQAEKTMLEANSADIDAKLTEIEQNIAENSQKRDLIDKENVKIINNQTNLKLEQANLFDDKNIIDSRVESLSQELENLKLDYHTKLSRQRVLEEMAEENEGYNLPIKRLLETSKTNSMVNSKIVGVVAKLMKVPANLEVAIEMALGASLQNIVTKTEDDAKYLVNFLKDHKFGRATFLPISSMKIRAVPDIVKDNLKYNGVLGVASDLISYDKYVSNIFESLLGSTVIVDNIDNAVNFSRLTRYSTKIVTLDGDVINPAGSISGGSRKENSTSIIGREREIAELKKELELLQKEISASTKKLDELKRQQQSLSEKLLDSSTKIHDTEVELVKVRDQKDKIEELLFDLERDKRQTLGSKANISDRISAVSDALKLATATADQKLMLRKEASENKKKADSNFDRLRQEREELYDSLTGLKLKQNDLGNTISQLEADIDRIGGDIASSEYRTNENKLSYQKNASEIAELQSMLNVYTSDKEYQEISGKITEIRSKLGGLDEYKKQQQTIMNQADSKKLELSATLQTIAEKRSREEMRISQIDSELETMQERVWEEYNMTYADALGYKWENYDNKESLAESAKLKRQIQQLGYVNVNAIEELAAVSARYNDLAGQRDDLLAAQDDLNKIIKELTTQMEDKFRTQFEKINTNFQKVFKELFGGGRAQLELLDENNILECGIDIIAEPPGKKLSNISLLSGGEKALTAVAILFAILKLRPMPFCVLDEIEAAFDDANVDRFARYLKNFSADTQFIVITHRKPTMELADCLYGVTMEEKGVSKMVSVKLSDAIKIEASA